MARVVGQTAMLPRFTTKPAWTNDGKQGPGTVFPFGAIEFNSPHADLFAAFMARVRAWKWTFDGEIDVSFSDGADTWTQHITTSGSLLATATADPFSFYSGSVHPAPLPLSGISTLFLTAPADALESEKVFANPFSRISVPSAPTLPLDVDWTGPTSSGTVANGAISTVINPDWEHPIASGNDNYEGYVQGYVFATTSHLYIPLHFQLEFGDTFASEDYLIGEFDYTVDTVSGDTQRFSLGYIRATLLNVEGSREIGTLRIKWYHPTEGSQEVSAPIYGIDPEGSRSSALLHGYSLITCEHSIDVTMECAVAVPYGFDPDNPDSFTTLNAIYDTATGEKLSG